ncbi:hypothetical protein JCM11251_001319 [Rhodosporidiobolus azoricus]
MSRRAPSPAPLVRPTPVRPPSPFRLSISSTPTRTSYVPPIPPPSRSTYPPAGRPPSPAQRLSTYLPPRSSSPANAPLRSSSPSSRPRVAFDLGGGNGPVPARPLSGIGYGPPRPRPSNLPSTPPPSRPSSASGFPPIPDHLSFIDPTRPPRALAPHHFPEKLQIPQTNLLMARGKPRLELTHWEHDAVMELQAAMRAHDGVQRECYSRMSQGPGLHSLREEVTEDVECLVEVSVALMRFMKYSQLMIQNLADATSRFVNIVWGDAAEWHKITAFHRDDCSRAISQTRHNSNVVRRFFDVGFDHFRDTASLLQSSGAYGSSPPPPFQSLLTHFTNAARSLERIHSAWTMEAEHFVSCDLRRRAQNGSRTAWYYLQYRLIAFESGVRTSQEMRGWLGMALEKYLNLTRSRGGLSAENYLKWHKKAQLFLPPGVVLHPRPEYCPR